VIFLTTSSIFAFGDIHGCLYELEAMLDILPLTSDSILVFVGDYVDRGPQSKQVIDRLLQLKNECSTITLMGNHEQMFLNYLRNPKDPQTAHFIYNGGSATLASYVDTKTQQILVPQNHLQFLHTLPLFYENDHYFFVHAGVPNKPLNSINLDEDASTLLWIRDPFLNSTYDWKKTIIHGHTPVKSVDRKKNRINVDTGLVYNNKLSVISLPSGDSYSVPKKEMITHIFLKNLSHQSKRKAERFEGSFPICLFKKQLQEKKKFFFMSKNYSDLGMLIVEEVAREKSLFQLQDEVEGEIQLDENSEHHLSFSAKIVRLQMNDQTHYWEYGLEFIKTPYEMIKQKESF
jgi:serine/threonine protein phosphatase 1